MARVLLIGGSPNSDSSSSTLLEYLGRRLEARGAQTEHLEVRTLPAEALMRCDGSNPSLRNAQQRLERTDGVVLGTPIYKASITGLLKAWLDTLPQYACRGKVILPVATGASLTSVMALDAALQPVLTSMGAEHTLPGLFWLADWISGHDPEEAFRGPANAMNLLENRLDSFLSLLPGNRGAQQQEETGP